MPVYVKLEEIPIECSPLKSLDNDATANTDVSKILEPNIKIDDDPAHSISTVVEINLCKSEKSVKNIGEQHKDKEIIFPKADKSAQSGMNIGEQQSYEEVIFLKSNKSAKSGENMGKQESDEEIIFLKANKSAQSGKKIAKRQSNEEKKFLKANGEIVVDEGVDADVEAADKTDKNACICISKRKQAAILCIAVWIIIVAMGVFIIVVL